MPSGASPSVDGNSKLGPNRRRLKRKKVPQGPLPSLVHTATTAVNDGASVADDQSILTSSIADDSLAHTLLPGGQWDGTSSVSSGFALDYGDTSEAMVVLQRLYDVARSRASEMAEGDGAHGFAIKQHTRMACKLYAAIASVLYSTLGAMQAAKMEEFIVKGGTQVPANLFDLHDWQSVLRLARKCRNEGGSVLVEKNRARMSRIQARTYSGLLEIVVELSERHRKARSTAEEELARLQSALETDKTAILGAVKLVTSELVTCRQRLDVARDEASRQKQEHEAATEAAANQAREALERARAEAEKVAADAASAVQRWSQDKEKEQAAARQVEEKQAKELQSWAMRLQTAEQALESALRERDDALRDRDGALRDQEGALRERDEALASAGSAAKKEKATQAVLEGVQLELVSALARAALSSSSSGEVAEGGDEGGAAAERDGIVATNLANLASQLVELRAALARQSVELTQAQEQAQHQEQAQAQIKNLGAALARAEAQLAEERERAQEREVGSSPAFASSPVSPSTQPEASSQASSSDELETMRKAAESARAQFDAQSRELKAVAAEQLQQAQERVQALETRLAESQIECKTQAQAESLAQQLLEAALAREQAMQAKLTVLAGSQSQADGQPDARTEALSQQLQQALAQAQAQSEEHARALSNMQAQAEEEVAALSKQLADAQAQLQLQAEAQAQALKAELPALSARQESTVSTEQSLQAELAALGLELQQAMQQLAESQAREKGLQAAAAVVAAAAAAAAATEGAETANVDGDAGAAIAALRVALAGAEARLSAAEAETENARAVQDQVLLAQSRDLESNLKHLQAEAAAARQVEENHAKELQSWAMRLQTAEQGLESALRERDEALRDREEALASAGSTANSERTTLEQSLALDQQQRAAQASNLQLQAALAKEQALQAELLAAHAALSQLQLRLQAQTQADGQPDARTEALSQQLQQAQAQAQAQSEEHARALSNMQAQAEEEVAALSKQLADAQAQLQLQAQVQAQTQALQEQAQTQTQTQSQAQSQAQASLDIENQAEQKQLAETLELLASSRQAEASLKKALSASQGHASGATAAEAAARAELAIVNSQLLEKQKHIERLQRKAAELLAAEGGDAWSVESPGESSIASSPSVHQSLREKLGAGPLTVERGITLAQAVARGIIARRRVMHEIAKVQASNNSGVLVAVEGTQQGRTGWYSRHAKHYFYFVIDDDEWLLLAGPLTWDMYLLARNEARLALGLEEDAGVGTAGLPGSLPSSRSGSRAASRGASRGRAETPETGLVGRGGRPSTSSSSPVPPKIRLTRRLLVDRVALRAVRVQVDILLGDVRDRDIELGLVRSSLDNYRVQVASDMELLHSKLVQRAVTAESQIASQAKAFQQRLLDAQALLVSTETALKAANNRAAALAQPLQSPEGAAAAVNMRLSMLAPLNKAAPLANIVRVQALVRGLLDRARLRRHIVALKALSGGVLVASDNTKQGESGWYCAPSGQYFYFVRDQQENWIMASGPLTSIQYEHSVRHPTTGLGGLSGSGAHSSTTARYRKPGVLTRCAFDLVPHHNAMIKSALAGGTGGGGNAASPMQESSWKWDSGVPGADGSYEPALYIQSRTAKLFVAVPLDVAIHLKSEMRPRANSVSFSDNEEEEE